MTDQQQRTQWAIDIFNGFVQSWVPPAVSRGLWTKRNPVNDDERVRTAIRDIAPIPDADAHIGYAVYKQDPDLTYNRDRPSGFIYTQVNVLISQSKKYPDNHYVICEIRRVP